jgi:hypothetical protein
MTWNNLELPPLAGLVVVNIYIIKTFYLIIYGHRLCHRPELSAAVNEMSRQGLVKIMRRRGGVIFRILIMENSVGRRRTVCSEHY